MYDAGVSATHPDTGTSTDVDALPVCRCRVVQGLDPEQLGAYFVLTEAVSLLQHQIEQQLRAEGDLSYVQFQLLARLNARGPLTMTDLADGVVYSRSGLTYQAGLLEKAGLITRGPSPDDERATLVTITSNGRALFGRGHARPHPGHPTAVRPPDRRRPAPPRRHHDPGPRPHARPATSLRRPPQTPPQPCFSARGHDAGLNHQREISRSSDWRAELGG